MSSSWWNLVGIWTTASESPVLEPPTQTANMRMRMRLRMRAPPYARAYAYAYVRVPPRGDVPPRDVHPRGRDHHRVDLFRGGSHRVQQGCVPFHLGLSWLWISVLDT